MSLELPGSSSLPIHPPDRGPLRERSGHEVRLPLLTARVTGPEELLRDLPALFPLIPQRTTAASVNTTAFDIAAIPFDAGYRLSRDGTVQWDSLDQQHVLPMLEWAITTAAVEYLGRDHVLFHAGAVARGNRGFVFPAASGSGKTTLVAALLRNGFHYLSDEVAVVAPNGPTLLPFPKGLCVKSGARHVLEPLYPQLADAAPRHRFGDERVWYLAPPAEAWPDIAITVRYVILPKYMRGAQTTLQPLARSAVVAPLLEQSFNAHRLGVRGVAEAVAMLAGADCYRLIIGDLGQAVDLLRDLSS